MEDQSLQGGKCRDTEKLNEVRKEKNMINKDAMTIAEYAIKKWLYSQGFAMEHFAVKMNGNEAVVSDRNGDELVLVYDRDLKIVYEKGVSE